MIVVVYIISGIGAIALSSFCMALVLWLNLEDASFDDLKDNLKLCVVYNVIINLVSLAVLGLNAVSPVLALIPAIAGIVISFKLLMNWFELSFLGAIFVLVAASVIHSVIASSLVALLTLLTS